MDKKIYNVVVGTAGHIDHGKTSLVRSLTGIDADRLKEEKERGLTIDLGFAPLHLPDGTKVGIIDVPGHEKFIKNMVAGATGIDIVVLVVAADDGVMPQTREHLDIMTLLGISRGLVALTKIDMVGEELLELAKEDLKDFVRGTFLEDAPLVPVSSETGEGVEEFQSTLYNLIDNCPPRQSQGVFRMPIQRIFAAKGYGTVVTGVPLSGSVAIGDKVEILPQKVVGRVRNLQAYKEDIDRAQTGHSTAINLADVDYKTVERGNVASAVDYFSPTQLVEGRFQYLPHMRETIKAYSEIKFHTGTAEIMGEIIPLKEREILPGEEVLIQLRLREPVVVGYLDRYILRRPSPATTLGGGILLGPSPEKRKRFDEETLASLKEKEELLQSFPGRLKLVLRENSPQPLRKEELEKRSHLTREEFQPALEKLQAEGEIISLGQTRYLLGRKTMEKVQDEILETLSDFHLSHSLRLGMARDELDRKFAHYNGQIIDAALEEMEEREQIEVHPGSLLSTTDFQVQLSAEEEEIRRQLEEIYLREPFSTPRPDELAEILNREEKKITPLLNYLLEKKILFELDEDVIFHRKALEQAREKVREYFQQESQLATTTGKDLLHTSRKYAIPLLEYLDETGLTRREGNHRVLISQEEAK